MKVLRFYEDVLHRWTSLFTVYMEVKQKTIMPTICIGQWSKILCVLEAALINRTIRRFYIVNGFDTQLVIITFFHLNHRSQYARKQMYEVMIS